MKTLLLLLPLLLSAETHHFKEVNFNGTTLKNVALVINNEQKSFNIWYQDRLLKSGNYKIVSCRERERFCLEEIR